MFIIAILVDNNERYLTVDKGIEFVNQIKDATKFVDESSVVHYFEITDNAGFRPYVYEITNKSITHYDNGLFEATFITNI